MLNVKWCDRCHRMLWCARCIATCPSVHSKVLTSVSIGRLNLYGFMTIALLAWTLKSNAMSCLPQAHAFAAMDIEPWPTVWTAYVRLTHLASWAIHDADRCNDKITALPATAIEYRNRGIVAFFSKFTLYLCEGCIWIPHTKFSAIFWTVPVII